MPWQPSGPELTLRAEKQERLAEHERELAEERARHEGGGSWRAFGDAGCCALAGKTKGAAHTYASRYMRALEMLYLACVGAAVLHEC